MAAISGGDLRAIFRFLAFGYAAVADAAARRATPRGALPRPVLIGLDGLIPASLVESFELRRGVDDGVPYTASHDEDELPAEVEEYAHLRGENPIDAFNRRPADGAVRLSGMMSARRLRQLHWHR